MRRNLIALLLICCITVGFFPSIGVSRVEAENKVYKASEFTSLNNYINLPDYCGSCVLNMDKDVMLSFITVNGDLRITGSGHLSVGAIYVTGKLTFDSKTDVEVYDTGGYLIKDGEKIGTFYSQVVYADKDIDICMDANLKFPCFSGSDDHRFALLSHNGNITTAGNINIESNECGLLADTIDIIGGRIDIACKEEAIFSIYLNIYSGTINFNCSEIQAIDVDKNIKITGGTIKVNNQYGGIVSTGNMQISGGNIEVTNKWNGIFAHDELSITGGKIVVSSGYGETINADDLKIDGGDISCYSDLNCPWDTVGNIGAYNSLIIGNDMYIVTPNNGKITKIDKHYSVTASDGSVPYTINISKKTNPNKKSIKYSNEWVDGKWYDAGGNQTYKGTMSWKSNASGWWIEDSEGWYPTDSWQKIDGIWYFFKPDGYMASNEYYNDYWFNADGSWDDRYFLSWKSNETGWWVEDKSGWWPASSWLKIDGYWYYFDASGYMVTNTYIDGWWIGADGVCY